MTPPVIADSLTILSGTGLAQVLLFASSPLLTRIYTPDEFGHLAVYSGSLAIGSIITTLRYEMGIVSVTNRQESDSLASVALQTTSLVCLLSLIATVAYVILGENAPLWWLLFAPGLFGMSLGLVLQNISLRETDFRGLALQKLTNVLTFILIAWVSPYKVSTTLVLGTCSGHMAAALVGIVRQRTNLKFLWPFTKSNPQVYQTAKAHAHIPVNLAPAAILESLAQHGATFAFASFFANNAVAGHYAMMNKIVLVPVTIFSTSIGQVFYKRFTDKAWDQRLEFLFKVWGLLALCALFPTLFLVFFGEQFFTMFLGGQWGVAGRMAATAAPLLFLMLISSPTQTAIFAVKGHRIMLLITTLLAIGKATSLWIAYAQQDFMLAIKGMIGFECFTIILFSTILLVKLRKQVLVNR